MRSRLLLGVGSVVIVASACVAGMRSTIETSYSNPDMTLQGIAILPVTAGEGLEGFRRHMASLLENQIAAQHPDVKVITSAECLRRINDLGLANEYSDMLETYGRTGILDRETLGELADAVGAQHMLQAQFSYEAADFVEVGAIGGGLNREERQELYVFGQLWDGTEGDVVWEVAGSVRSRTGEFTFARDVEDILAQAITDLVAELPLR